MNTFTDYLFHKTKKQLIDLAKIHQFHGYSVLKKAELAHKLAEYIYTPAVMYHFFVYLGEDELLLLNTQQKGFSPLYRRLYEGGYCFLQPDGSYEIPSALSALFTPTDTFFKEQKIKSFLLDCVNTAGYLYGCCPVSIIENIYNSYASYPLSQKMILEELQSIPAYFHSFIIENDFVIQKSLYKNDLYKKIQKCQGLLPFFIPDKKTILHLSRFGYFPEDPYTKHLSLVLSQSPELPLETAQHLSGEIQAIFRQGGTIQDALIYLQKSSFSAQLEPFLTTGMENPTKNKLLIALNQVFSHAPLLLNRGYTAAESIKLKQKRQKIYPNSRCPCGSGKKYKNCCGRH